MRRLFVIDRFEKKGSVSGAKEAARSRGERRTARSVGALHFSHFDKRVD
jgi:hypothetical protein